MKIGCESDVVGDLQLDSGAPAKFDGAVANLAGVLAQCLCVAWCRAQPIILGGGRAAFIFRRRFEVGTLYPAQREEDNATRTIFWMS